MVRYELLVLVYVGFFFQPKTAYEIRLSSVGSEMWIRDGYYCPGIETTGFASYLCTLYGRSAAIQLHIPAFLDARRVTS